MPILRQFMRAVFYLLYHPFAWTYDLVAAAVSMGRWKTWVRAVVPLLPGPRILELGHGPGHLQRALLDRRLLAVGLDESSQMGRLARRNLRRGGHTHPALTRGLAQNLPFPDQAFEALVATFPAEYFLDPKTVAEAYRVLKPKGCFIILPVALITGTAVLDRFSSWLFTVTGQAPSDPLEAVSRKLSEPFIRGGFKVRVQRVEKSASLLLILLACKP